MSMFNKDSGSNYNHQYQHPSQYSSKAVDIIPKDIVKNYDRNIMSGKYK